MTRYKHPLAIRWFHWIHFPVLLAMVWSGLLILWAYDAYPTETLRLKVPETVFGVSVGYRLAEGMAWHFTLAWVFALNGLAYVAYLALTGQWRHLIPGRGALVGAAKVALHDLTHWRGPKPEGGAKYNDAQKIAYTAVSLLGFGMLVTGLAIYKPAQLGWLAETLGGYQAARREHFLITGLLIAFFVVHIAQVLRAGWNNLRAMLTGWEVE